MPMRVSEADEERGLDATQHDEKYLQGTLLVNNSGVYVENEVAFD
jgi:Amt family ammonium transporter